MRAYELTPRGYELLEKFHKGVERIKKTYDLGYIAGIHKLSNLLEDKKAYAKKEEAKGKETLEVNNPEKSPNPPSDKSANVQDSSKKKVEKVSNKATKSPKSKEGKVQNVANFTLLQEPTKVFLEFEDEENQAYYNKFADKQGFVGADFLNEVKDLKKTESYGGASWLYQYRRFSCEAYYFKNYRYRKPQDDCCKRQSSSCLRMCTNRSRSLCGYRHV